MKNLNVSHKFLVCLSLTALSLCAHASDCVSLGLADLGSYGIDRASIALYSGHHPRVHHV